jgi:hypothetical protein
MKSYGAKQLIKQWCPPALWNALRSGARRCLARSRGGPRVLRTVEDLDREIARADQAAQVSDDELRRTFLEFRFACPGNLPPDPSAPEYREAQLALYRLLAGRDSYVAETGEVSTFDLAAGIECPFPYATRSSTTVGEQLMAIGFLVRALQLRPGDRILEFGPGWGKSTLEFAQMGYPVTAVDINPLFLDLIRARAARLRLDVSLLRSDMLSCQPASRFERVVFYESFHHCSDHVRMIARLDSLVARGGAVLFAGEPIEDDFPMPWGIRLDGMSVYSIRKHGWLELGFRTDYFLNVLARHGWVAERLQSLDVPWGKVFVARRASEAHQSGRAA